MSFAGQLEGWLTCMYVRLLGPCFKTGRKPSSYTPVIPGGDVSPPDNNEPRRQNPFDFDAPRGQALTCGRGGYYSLGDSPAAVSYSAPGGGGLPPPTPFYEPGCPVHIRRISCSFSSSDEVLFSFPLRYLFAIGYCAFIFSLGGPAPPVFS